MYNQNNSAQIQSAWSRPPATACRQPFCGRPRQSGDRLKGLRKIALLPDFHCPKERQRRNVHAGAAVEEEWQTHYQICPAKLAFVLFENGKGTAEMDSVKCIRK